MNPKAYFTANYFPELQAGVPWCTYIHAMWLAPARCSGYKPEFFIIKILVEVEQCFIKHAHYIYLFFFIVGFPKM